MIINQASQWLHKAEDQEAFMNNNDEEAVAAKNPESEEYKVNEKIKKEHKNFIFGEGVSGGTLVTLFIVCLLRF